MKRIIQLACIFACLAFALHVIGASTAFAETVAPNAGGDAGAAASQVTTPMDVGDSASSTLADGGSRAAPGGPAAKDKDAGATTDPTLGQFAILLSTPAPAANCAALSDMSILDANRPRTLYSCRLELTEDVVAKQNALATFQKKSAELARAFDQASDASKQAAVAAAVARAVVPQRQAAADAAKASKNKAAQQQAQAALDQATRDADAKQEGAKKLADAASQRAADLAALGDREKVLKQLQDALDAAFKRIDSALPSITKAVTDYCDERRHPLDHNKAIQWKEDCVEQWQGAYNYALKIAQQRNAEADTASAAYTQITGQTSPDATKLADALKQKKITADAKAAADADLSMVGEKLRAALARQDSAGWTYAVLGAGDIGMGANGLLGIGQLTLDIPRDGSVSSTELVLGAGEFLEQPRKARSFVLRGGGRTTIGGRTGVSIGGSLLAFGNPRTPQSSFGFQPEVAIVVKVRPTEPETSALGGFSTDFRVKMSPLLRLSEPTAVFFGLEVGVGYSARPDKNP